VRRVVEHPVWRKRARSRAELRREVEALRLLGRAGCTSAAGRG
jgi:hypothetical protein